MLVHPPPPAQLAIAVDLFGIEFIADGMGISNMAQGVAIVVGPPIGGLLYQVTGTYRVTFLMSGFAMAASGLLQGSLRAVALWESAKKK